ncbi:DUF4240 domain-containing protein [Angustibacter speluncae]
MPDDEFWGLIELLGGQAVDIEPLVSALAKGPRRRIQRFDDALARALHALDLYALAVQPVQEPDDATEAVTPLSDDGFLYARCAVVASGRRRYEQVLDDPNTFAGIWSTDGEALLDAAGEAWERLTGREWEHDPPVSVETGSNPAGGWPAPPPAVLEPSFGIDWSEHGIIEPRDSWFKMQPHDWIHVSGPVVERDISDLMAENGWWPGRLTVIAVGLQPADYWDLLVRSRNWVQNGPGFLKTSDADAAVYRQLVVITNKPVQRQWDPATRQRVLRGVVSHVVLTDLTLKEPGHGALPQLHAWREAARDLVPFPPA